MLRVELAGDGLAGFRAGEFTDHYVKVKFPPAEPDGRMRTRAFTVRTWDPEAGRLTLDIVDHGDTGVAGPWLSALAAGDEVTLSGPGGSYAPDPDAAWHLLAGDESVVPAIAASLERMPVGAKVIALIEVNGPGDELALESPAALDLRWLHRVPGADADESPLVGAVRGLKFPTGGPQVFLHGEATAVRELIRHLVVDRGLDRNGMSASAYWKLRHTDEDWRAVKPEWKRQVAAESSPA